PRFIYLILCDREFVTQALGNFAPNRGAEFLEKIVQVGFDVPAPLWSELAQMASSDWDRMLKLSPDALRRRDKKRWDHLLGLCIPYLKNVRAVRRWMNAVRFSFAVFETKDNFDANPEDVAGIEL